MTSPFVLFWPSTTWRGAPTLRKEICFSRSTYSMLISSENTLTDIPGIALYQISGHPIAQSRWHIKLTITILKMYFYLLWKYGFLAPLDIIQIARQHRRPSFPCGNRKTETSRGCHSPRLSLKHCAPHLPGLPGWPQHIRIWDPHVEAVLSMRANVGLWEWLCVFLW